jgi:hypothetical protein
MGESRPKALAARRDAGDASQAPQVVDTLGGRMHVRWDEHAAAMPNGQLVFFAEFLAATGVFDRWVSSCPLSYRSGNAPDKRDVLGTLMLAMLARPQALRAHHRAARRRGGGTGAGDEQDRQRGRAAPRDGAHRRGGQ